MRLRSFLKAGLALGAALTLSSLQAQGFPSKTMTLVVPYPAEVVIGNLGGASGALGI